MARDYQKVVLVGRLGAAPEIKEFSNGNKVANFGLASSNGYMKDGEWVDKPDWHNIVAMKQAVDVVERFAIKGTKVLVEGQIAYEEYEKDGVKMKATKIKVFRVDILDGFKPKDDEGESRAEESQDAGADENDLPF